MMMQPECLLQKKAMMWMNELMSLLYLSMWILLIRPLNQWTGIFMWTEDLMREQYSDIQLHYKSIPEQKQREITVCASL